MLDNINTLRHFLLICDTLDHLNLEQRQISSGLSKPMTKPFAGFITVSLLGCSLYMQKVEGEFKRICKNKKIPLDLRALN